MFSISEQYTAFDRAKDLPDNSIRNGELVRGYSTTQLGLAYDLLESLGLQLTIPLIIRRYDKIRNFRAATEHDSGFGDISLSGYYTFYNYNDGERAVRAGVSAGVKFPTGDTGVLRDIDSTQSAPGSAQDLLFKHHTSGVSASGRALTFGTGSYDYILGLNNLLRHQRLLFFSYLQYTLRTEGDFNYEFADDLTFSSGPGYFIFLEHDRSIALRLALSGEFKGKDELNNRSVEGSQVSNLYLGPEILFLINAKISGEAGLDFRVSSEDSGAQVVPHTRIRFGLSYRFS